MADNNTKAAVTNLPESSPSKRRIISLLSSITEIISALIIEDDTDENV